jgi:glutathione S-transferase
MPDYTIVLANKNYSSWSLRPWLALKRTGAAFDEVVIFLDQPDTKRKIAEHTPSGKVPVLRHKGRQIWDSLAILEYLHEQFPKAKLWPEDASARAHARAVAAEMHSSFQNLRNNMPMNMRRNAAGKGRGPGVEDDITRITELWEDCRSRFGKGGDLLFGHFTNADAMYAPVVSRFRTYGVKLPKTAQTYADAVAAMPEFQEWAAAGKSEPSIPKYEI